MTICTSLVMFRKVRSFWASSVRFPTLLPRMLVDVIFISLKLVVVLVLAMFLLLLFFSYWFLVTFYLLYCKVSILLLNFFLGVCGSKLFGGDWFV